jgi:hypothetical protein
VILRRRIVDYYVSRRYRRKTLKPVLKKTFTVEKILMDRNYSSSTVEGILLEIIIEELHVVIIIGDKLLLSLNVCVNKVLPKNFFCGPSNIFNNKIIIGELHNIEELPLCNYRRRIIILAQNLYRKLLLENVRGKIF